MPKVNTNTSKSRSPLQVSLAGIPAQFREKIIKSYTDLKQNLSAEKYEAAGLAAGKFCESNLRLLQHILTGTSIPFGKQIANFADECRKLVQVSVAAGLESQRVIIPRALVYLYTLRNKRGIGHVGGDVDANSIDAATLARISDWIVCELIRIHHNLPIEEAQALVDSLATRAMPQIWNVAGKRRVLKKGLDFKFQVMLLAYTDLHNGVLVEDLIDWTEYSNPGVFKKSVLKPLHDERLIEYDRSDEIVYLSPLGIQAIEQKLSEE